MSTATQQIPHVGVRRVIDCFTPFDEVIDGMRPSDAAKMVDLSIGYTPVLLDPWHESLGPRIPQPTRVITDGSKFAAIWTYQPLGRGPEFSDFQNLDDDDHRISRARYLLLRGWLYQNFDRYFSYPEQRAIVAWYFDGAMWRPKEGSELYEKMCGGAPR